MNGFGDEGALAVAELLKRSTTLYVLDISYNRISQIGATAIGKALDQNDALRTLRVIQFITLNASSFLINRIKGVCIFPVLTFYE